MKQLQGIVYLEFPAKVTSHGEDIDSNENRPYKSHQDLLIQDQFQTFLCYSGVRPAIA